MRNMLLVGTCVLAVVVAATFAQSARAVAAATGPASVTAEPALQEGFAQVSGWVTKAADMVPADKYSYRPVATVRTFGQLVAHIADSYVYSCSNAVGKKTEWAPAIEKGATDKAAIVARLKQATDACTAAYKNGQTGPLVENIGHANLHYGNIITYLRMMGMVPPSS